MNDRPHLQYRVTQYDDARYHGGTRRGSPRGIIWHATAGDTVDGARSWLDRLDKGPEGKLVPIPRDKRASYNYLIGKDGRIFRTVHPDVIADHAGLSSWKGLSLTGVNTLNPVTIGIAFANDNGTDRNPEDDDLTPAQLESGLWLGSVMAERYDIRPEFQLSHREVSPGRKFDPLARILDMDHWRALMAAASWPATLQAHP